MLHRGNKPGALYRGAYKPGALYRGAQLVAGYADVSKAAPATWDGTYGDFVSIAAQGRGKQQTYSGKNLLMTNRETFTLNGVTVERLADGRYRISGTPTEPSSLHLGNGISLSLAAGTYTLSQTPAAASLNISALLLPGWRGGTFSLDEATTFTNIYIDVPSAAVGQELDFVYGPQLERGDTATAYEPYVGGQPSPSPNYPQPLVAAEGALTASGRTGTTPTTVTLPVLRAIPGTDICDTLEYVGGGQWKVTRRVGVIQLTGTENWQSGGGSYSAEQSIVATGTWGICDTYAWIFSREGSGMYVAGSVVAIGAAAAAAYGSLDEWKRYLAERYDKDDPLTLWVRLATPTTETVTMGTLPSYPVHTELDISGDFPPDVIGTCKTGI